MRMLTTKPEAICTKHLIEEHNDMHNIYNHLLKHRPIDHWIAAKSVAIMNIDDRHFYIVKELSKRRDGYKLGGIVKHKELNNRISKNDVFRIYRDKLKDRIFVDIDPDIEQRLICKCKDCFKKYKKYNMNRVINTRRIYNNSSTLSDRISYLDNLLTYIRTGTANPPQEVRQEPLRSDTPIPWHITPHTHFDTPIIYDEFTINTITNIPNPTTINTITTIPNPTNFSYYTDPINVETQAEPGNVPGVADRNTRYRFYSNY